MFKKDMTNGRLANIVASLNIYVNVSKVKTLAHSDTITDINNNLILWHWDKPTKQLGKGNKVHDYEPAKELYSSKYEWLYRCGVGMGTLWTIHK